MPNVDSAKKRVLTNEKRRVRNRFYKARVKNTVKKVLTDIEANAEKDLIMQDLSLAFKALDKAASKGSIHKKQANRKKSRLHMKVKKHLGEIAE